MNSTQEQSQSKKSLFNTLPPWVVIGISASLVIGVGFGIIRWTAAQPETETPTPTVEAPQRLQVVALGRLEPQGELIKVGGAGGARIDRLLVKQGDWVKANQILVYLDSYDERLAERDLAASQLRESQVQLSAETSFQKAQIEEAQTRIRQIDQPQALEMQAQESRIRELRATLSLARQDLKRDQQLQQEGAIAQQDLDRQITQVEEVEAQLKTAEATLAQLKIARSSNLTNATAQLKAAEANMPLSQVRTAVESARQNLKLVEARLENTIIRAPQEGRVLRIITQQGESIPSAPTGGDEGILELGNTRQMMVVAEVYESDVDLVKVGQKVTIASRNGAFTDILTGEVAEVGWQIFKNNVLDDDPAANADARIVEVKIRIDQSDRVEGLTNLQVDVRIEV